MKIGVGLKVFFLILIFFVSAKNSYSQYNKFSVKFIDSQNKDALPGVLVSFCQKSDTSICLNYLSDSIGNVFLTNLQSGTYYLKTSYLGYAAYKKEIEINEDLNLETIKLQQTAKLLKNIDISDKAIRIEQKGDTAVYNANAYKVNPDATAENLLNKMPGISIENGTIKANGEDVKKVLIDGKEFFGDDVSMAIKNLPAEIIQKIQVFDRMSEQARFTGFDDGNSQKTLNINTKLQQGNGQFGKIYAAVGEDIQNQNLLRYQHGGNLNIFNSDRRISLIGLSNNINQQNFNAQDLVGINPGAGQGRGQGANQGRMGSRGNNMFNSGSMSDFFVGQQSGINTTSSYGINYSDKWGAKTLFTGSYFFNKSANNNINSTERTFFNAEKFNPVYTEENTSNTINYNNRLNTRFEISLDSMNSLVFSPKLNFQSNSLNSSFTGINKLSENISVNNTNNQNHQNSNAYNISADAVFKHKFLKFGRTITFDLNSVFTDNSINSNLINQNTYFLPIDSFSSFNQWTKSLSKTRNLSGGINYTEALSKNQSLQFNYNPSVLEGNSDKSTTIYNPNKGINSFLDSLLSNNFNNLLITHKTGVSYRKSEEKYNLLVGVNYQKSELSAKEYFPDKYTVYKSFENILPNATFNYFITKKNNLKFVYRTSTNVPSINQLQAVLNNANPLQLSIGNPDLTQEYNHHLMTRYSNTNTEKGTAVFVYLSANLNQNYIGKQTYIAQEQFLFEDKILLQKGAQISKFVNLSGYRSLRSFLSYSVPIQKISSNLNINTGLNMNRIPSVINDINNFSNTVNASLGLVLSSNISEKIDFTINHTGNYNLVLNSITNQSNTTYLIQNSSFKINVIPFKTFLINAEAINFNYQGLGNLFNSNIFICNVALGYKFLKNKSLDFRVSVYDLFNNNNSINRTVTETYIEDNQTNVLRRYWLITLSYNLRRFISKADGAVKEDSMFKKM